MAESSSCSVARPTKFSTAAVVRVDASTGTSRPAGTLAEACTTPRARRQRGASARWWWAERERYGGCADHPGERCHDRGRRTASSRARIMSPSPSAGRPMCSAATTATTSSGMSSPPTTGSRSLKLARPPVPVRYPAVAAVGKMIYLFGGVMNSQAGIDTSVVQRLDTANGKIEIVAQLPTSLSHASAMVLDGQVFVVGGYVNNTQLSDQVLRFNLTSATTEVAGHLPIPISDAAAAVIANRGFLVGGQGTDRAPVASVTTISVG